MTAFRGAPAVVRADARQVRRKNVLRALADVARRDAAHMTGPRVNVLREHARELEFQAACFDALGEG